MKLKNKIGVIVDAFKLPIREGLLNAKELGVDGVQIFAVKGEMLPENINTPMRKELKAYIHSLGLEVSALCGDFARYGFQNRLDNPEVLARSKAILDLANDLGSNIVTTHIGLLPEDEGSDIYLAMFEACCDAGEYAMHRGSYFAIETGAIPAIRLKHFLDSLPNKGIAVNYDPANVAMILGEDATESYEVLKDYVVHTHVKDGIQKKKLPVEWIYSSFGTPTAPPEMKAEVKDGKVYTETPLGEGDVNFDRYFSTLEQSGYKGYLTVEREGGATPYEDIEKAVRFIRKYK
jgi:sugar phosphate isomerase/epimerase